MHNRQDESFTWCARILLLYQVLPLLRCAGWCVFVGVCWITPAQGDVLQMDTIDGLACVRVDLTREQTTIPSHAVLDIGVRAPALIHQI